MKLNFLIVGFHQLHKIDRININIAIDLSLKKKKKKKSFLKFFLNFIH